MVASTEQGLQKIMEGLTTTTKQNNMKINGKKIKAMRISKYPGGTVSVLVDGQVVEQVKGFKYWEL